MFPPYGWHRELAYEWDYVLWVYMARLHQNERDVLRMPIELRTLIFERELRIIKKESGVL